MNLNIQVNPAYIPQLKNKKRYEVIYGGAGSGKSHFIAQRLVLRALEERRKFLVVRKVAKTNRFSTFSLISEIVHQWGLDRYFAIHNSMLYMQCANRSEIIFSGLDDVSKLKSIVGISDIWVEEATEITKEDFLQLDLRVRGDASKKKRITLSFNPVSITHWLKEHFIDSQTEDASILRTTYKDNFFIDDEYKRILERLQEQDRSFYQVYALGEWGVLSELIYTHFQVVNEVPERFDEVIYGLDFGFNNPSVLIKLGIKDQDVYIAEEFYKTRLTNSDLIQVLESHVSKKHAIYADAAEPDRIEEIRRAGFRIYPADKSVKDGIDHVKRTSIYVSSECANTIKEVQNYRWKQDKDGKLIDEPVKFADHCMDAVRYAIHTHLKKGNKTVKSGRIDI